jgi:hypothetical protein
MLSIRNQAKDSKTRGSPLRKSRWGLRRGGSNSLPQTFMGASSRRIFRIGELRGVRRRNLPERHGAPSPSGASPSNVAETERDAAGAQRPGRRRGRRGGLRSGKQSKRNRDEIGIRLAGTRGPPMGQVGSSRLVHTELAETGRGISGIVRVGWDTGLLENPIPLEILPVRQWVERLGSAPDGLTS